jgi:hypothetical protein
MQISRVFFYYTVMKLAYCFFERGPSINFIKQVFLSMFFHMFCYRKIVNYMLKGFCK